MSTLNCPACARPMRPMTLHDAEVDECPRCGGIWFDAHELNAVSHDHVEDSALENADFSEESRLCPRDQNALLETTIQDIPAATCPACHGFWLDGLSVDALIGLATSTTTSHDVVCAGCGATVAQNTTILRMDAPWCEACVVKGDYPGGTGRTIASRRAEMGQAMLKEVRKREQIKDNQELFDQLNVRIPVHHNGWQSRVDIVGWLWRRFNR